MEQAYFLIPGLLLNSEARTHLSDTTIQRLTEMTRGITAASTYQVLSSSSRKKSPHYQWLWSVLTQKNFPYATAPFRWLQMQGPMLGGEIWRLSLTKTQNNAFTTAVALSEASAELVASTLTQSLVQAGFTLQRWDKALFLTRKTPWGVTAREFETLYRETPTLEDAIEPISDSSAAVRARETLQQLTEKIQSLNCPDFDALWIDGGGYAQDFYPPTLVRSVLSDDPAILGWAQAAGILNHRTAKSTAATGWPEEAPRGTCIAVLENLYQPWLERDWMTWEKRVSDVIDQLVILKDAARRRGCEQALIVGFGEISSVTFTTKLTNPRSLLAKFVRSAVEDSQQWLIEPDF